MESNHPVVEFVMTHPEGIIPYQIHAGDAGFDLAIYTSFLLAPFSFTDVSIGVAIKMPQGIYGRITNRSSTKRKWRGINVVEGIIDPSYTGELFIGIENNNAEQIRIDKGTRLAQIIFSPFVCPVFVEVNELATTSRGKRGFGSTGV